MSLSTLARALAGLLLLASLVIVAATVYGLVGGPQPSLDLVVGAVLFGAPCLLGAGLLLGLARWRDRFPRAPAPAAAVPTATTAASVPATASDSSGSGCTRCGGVTAIGTSVCQDCSFEMFSEGGDRASS